MRRLHPTPRPAASTPPARSVASSQTATRTAWITRPPTDWAALGDRFQALPEGKPGADVGQAQLELVVDALTAVARAIVGLRGLAAEAEVGRHHLATRRDIGLCRLQHRRTHDRGTAALELAAHHVVEVADHHGALAGGTDGPRPCGENRGASMSPCASRWSWSNAACDNIAPAQSCSTSRAPAEINASDQQIRLRMYAVNNAPRQAEHMAANSFKPLHFHFKNRGVADWPYLGLLTMQATPEQSAAIRCRR